jgi:hypothetical protein
MKRRDSCFRTRSGRWKSIIARGIFQDRFGFGRAPAVVVVDFAYGWTDDGYARGSRRLDGPVEATRQLLDVARAKALPVVYMTSPWQPQSGEQHFKSAADRSLGFRAWDERACRIDERVIPHPRANETQLASQGVSSRPQVHPIADAFAYGPRLMARRSRLCVTFCTRSSGP